MFRDSQAFSGFSVDTIENVKEFYGQTLGLAIEEHSEVMSVLILHLATGGDVFIYPKADSHQPAAYTVLNFPVKDIDTAVDELTALGVEFIHYDNEMIKTDNKGIARSVSPDRGPNIAWFKDPAGNILAILEDM